MSVPVSPSGSPGVSGVVLGFPPPPCRSCCCCWLWGRAAAPSSLRVLPVVLPYGRLRHAVLPQGRTTDGMPGLPLRLRTAAGERSKDSGARPALLRSGFGGVWEESGCPRALGVSAQPRECAFVCVCVRGAGLLGARRDASCSQPSSVPSRDFLSDASKSTSQTVFSTSAKAAGACGARCPHQLPAGPRSWALASCRRAAEAQGLSCPCPLCRGAASSSRPSLRWPQEPLLTALALSQGMVLPPVPRGAQPHVLPLRVRWQKQLLPADQPCLLHQPRPPHLFPLHRPLHCHGKSPTRRPAAELCPAATPLHPITPLPARVLVPRVGLEGLHQSGATCCRAGDGCGAEGTPLPGAVLRGWLQVLGCHPRCCRVCSSALFLAPAV